MKSSLSFNNKKANWNYILDKSIEAGIKLVGSEVKSLRTHGCSFEESFCLFNEGNLEIKNMYIYDKGNAFGHNPLQTRRLLLHKKELFKLQKLLIKGTTIVPVRLYENSFGMFKLEIAIGKGKKNYDKRISLKELDLKREIERL